MGETFKPGGKFEVQRIGLLRICYLYDVTSPPSGFKLLTSNFLLIAYKYAIASLLKAFHTAPWWIQILILQIDINYACKKMQQQRPSVRIASVKYDCTLRWSGYMSALHC